MPPLSLVQSPTQPLLHRYHHGHPGSRCTPTLTFPCHPLSPQACGHHMCSAVRSQTSVKPREGFRDDVTFPSHPLAPHHIFSNHYNCTSPTGSKEFVFTSSLPIADIIADTIADIVAVIIADINADIDADINALTSTLTSTLTSLQTALQTALLTSLQTALLTASLTSLSTWRSLAGSELFLGSGSSGWNAAWAHVLYEAVGWVAFLAWSTSFYPQLLLNYRRKR